MKKELYKAALLRSGDTTFKKGTIYDFTDAQFKALSDDEQKLFRDYKSPVEKVPETEVVKDKKGSK